MTKTVLITKGRFPALLNLMRNLAKNGVRVLVAETTLFHFSSLSNANAKNILVPSPRDCPQGYIQRLKEIMEQEKVDLLIPGWEDVLIISKHLHEFPEGKVFTSDFSLIHSLHNKWEFSKLLTRLGFSTPATFIAKSKEDLQNMPFDSFYIKTCYSRASQGTFRVKDKSFLPELDFGSNNLYLAQEECKGRQLCTYSIAHKGKLTAHATYPFAYESLDPSKSRTDYCLSFEVVENPKILKFVEEFVAKTNYTGSIAFDIFIEPDGNLKILECNPRITSGITLMTEDKNLKEAFFNENEKLITPEKETQVQFFLPSLLIKTSKAIKSGSFKPFFKTLFKAKELTFSLKDIKPFLFLPCIGIYYLYLKLKHKKNLISSYSYDFDYEGE